MKLILLGATGLVGSHVLEQALLDHRIDEIIAPTRRAMLPRDRLRSEAIDYERLPRSAEWWAAYAVICALGTTRRKAGSAAAFREFDHDRVLAAIELARRHGTPTLALVSSAGANSKSPFLYTRVKGDTERDVAALGFTSLTILRPGLIGGERPEGRPMERLATLAASVVHPVLPIAWRINPARRIASRLIEAAVSAVPGRQVVVARELT